MENPIKQVRSKINKERAYDTVSEDFIRTFVNKVKFVHKNDKKLQEAEMSIALSCYTGCNTFYGSTDYIDHRNDTKKDLKKILFDRIESDKCLTTLQLGNYYDNAGNVVKEIRLTGSYGNWMAHFVYETGKSYFGR